MLLPPTSEKFRRFPARASKRDILGSNDANQHLNRTLRPRVWRSEHSRYVKSRQLFVAWDENPPEHNQDAAQSRPTFEAPSWPLATLVRTNLNKVEDTQERHLHRWSTTRTGQLNLGMNVSHWVVDRSVDTKKRWTVWHKLHVDLFGERRRSFYNPILRRSERCGSNIHQGSHLRYPPRLPEGPFYFWPYGLSFQLHGEKDMH